MSFRLMSEFLGEKTELRSWAKPTQLFPINMFIQWRIPLMIHDITEQHICGQIWFQWSDGHNMNPVGVKRLMNQL